MAETRQVTAFGLFKERSQVENAVKELEKEGFSRESISVLFNDPGETKSFAHEAHSKAPEGASIGGSTGGVLGGVLGFLTGIGAIAIPGVGPFVAAGPIMATLAGIGVGSTLGAITGTLIGLGLTEVVAKEYESKVREGDILASVHCDDTATAVRAKGILARCGANETITGETAAESLRPTAY